MADSTSRTFFAAVESADLRAIADMIDVDPDLPNIRRADESNAYLTPLQLSASKGNLQVCRLLVERGAEVYPNPMNTYPPVMLAAWNKHAAVVAYFLDEIPSQAAGTNGLGVMINLAARQGWTDIVRQHIERDTLAVHQRGWIGDSPLHWPAHNNHVEIVRLLLDAGADTEADEINCYGGKPLHWASESAAGAVEMLLQRGANVNSRVRRAESKFFGATPLIWNATQKDDCSEITKMLLAAGADPAATDALGKTALDHARQRQLAKITAVLELHGRC